MGRNTAQAGQRWSRRGPKPEPVAPSWETLGMERWDGEDGDDIPCGDTNCWTRRDGNWELHAFPNKREWIVLIEDRGGVSDCVETLASEAAAFDFCRRLLALPPTPKNTAPRRG